MNGTRNPVELVPFDPQWSTIYRRIEGELRALIADLVVAIDHVGSTSIDGMIAKPVIDIDVTVRRLDDISPASRLLVEAGYQPRGNRYDDEMWAFMTFDPSPARRIYLCPPGNETHRRRIVFRDHLRRHPETASDYAALKSRLAHIYRNDGDGYTAAKRAFIDDVVRQATPAG